MLIASATLMASIALSILNLKGGQLIYSELSSTKNIFDCNEPPSIILIDQKASSIVFAASAVPCLFPNTFDQDERRESPSLGIFQEVLTHVLEGKQH